MTEVQNFMLVVCFGCTIGFLTTGISGGTYNGLEQERNLGRIEKCLGEDVQ